MFKKIAALMLCMALIAGCSAAPSTQPAVSSSAAPAAEQTAPEGSYTYVNPDPDMVMITTKDGDITYKDYRLYMDITEQFSRYTTRQQLAILHTIEKDLAELGITINEVEFETMAVAQLEMLYQYYPSFKADMLTVAELAGLNEQQAEAVVKKTSRMDYLISILGDHYQKLALEELGEFDPSTLEYKENDVVSREEFEAEQQMLHNEKVYEHAMDMLNAYSTNYNDRINLDDDKFIALVDGEEVPYTDTARHFIDYGAASSRFDAAAIIQQGELIIRDPANSDLLDEKTFDDDFNAYVESVKADTEYIEKIKPFCEKFGATIDDYFLSFKRMAWLETAGNNYTQKLGMQYAELYPAPADGSEPEVSFDEYSVAEMDKLFEGSEIVNIMGK